MSLNTCLFADFFLNFHVRLTNWKIEKRKLNGTWLGWSWSVNHWGIWDELLYRLFIPHPIHLKPIENFNPQILRLLDNEDLDPSKLDGIKEDVEYYIEVISVRTCCEIRYCEPKYNAICFVVFSVDYVSILSVLRRDVEFVQ